MEHVLCSDVNSLVHRLFQSGPNQLGVLINLCLNTQQTGFIALRKCHTSVSNMLSNSIM